MASPAVRTPESGSRARTPLTEEAMWKRLKDAGFDEESIKLRDKATLIAAISKLEIESTAKDNSEQIAKRWQNWQMALNMDFKTSQMVFVPFRHAFQNGLLVIKFSEQIIQCFVDYKPWEYAYWITRASEIRAYYWTFMLLNADMRSSEFLDFSYELVNPFDCIPALDNDYSCGIVIMHLMECLSDSNYNRLTDISALKGDFIFEKKISICSRMVLSNMNRRRSGVLRGVAHYIQGKEANVAETSV